jgi:hypothetical protein
MALKLKVDDKGVVTTVEQNGVKLPVFVDDVDGREIPFDAEQTRTRIAELNNEAATRRVKLKEATDTLSKFGSHTPEDLLAAIATVTELGGPEGITRLKKNGAVDVEAVKKSITEAYEGKLKDKDSLITSRDNTIYSLMVGTQFANSPFVKQRLNLPPDMVQAKFGNNFRVEEGRVVAYVGEHPVMSQEKPGEVAGFEEAIAYLVNQYPHKDHILKGTNQTGGGSGGSTGSIGGIRSRADFKSDADKAAYIRENGLDAFKNLPAN